MSRSAWKQRKHHIIAGYHDMTTTRLEEELARFELLLVTEGRAGHRTSHPETKEEVSRNWLHIKDKRPHRIPHADNAELNELNCGKAIPISYMIACRRNAIKNIRAQRVQDEKSANSYAESFPEAIEPAIDNNAFEIPSNTHSGRCFVLIVGPTAAPWATARRTRSQKSSHTWIASAPNRSSVVHICPF